MATTPVDRTVTSGMETGDTESGTETSIALAEQPQQIARCFEVMRALRPHLATADEFLRRVQQQQRAGYRLAYLQVAGEVGAVAGFRFMENLAWGRFLYVDDLVTRESHRSRGFGGRMLAWLTHHAEAEGCGQLHLDSGVQRFATHRFYFGQGMVITSHHFARSLP